MCEKRGAVLMEIEGKKERGQEEEEEDGNDIPFLGIEHFLKACIIIIRGGCLFCFLVFSFYSYLALPYFSATSDGGKGTWGSKKASLLSGFFFIYIKIVRVSS